MPAESEAARSSRSGRRSAAEGEKLYEIAFRVRGSTEPLAVLRVRDRELYRQAKQWNYILRNRSRLAGGGSEELQDRFEAFFQDENRRQLGRRFLTVAAEAGVLEVAIPWRKKAAEVVGWAARSFPWESALGLATKRRRGSRLLTVVRCLDLKPAAPAVIPARLLFVQSAPADLRVREDFRIERELVQTALSCHCGEPVVDPDRKTLKEIVRDARPDVIHLSAMDAHRAAWLLPEAGIVARRDGVVLRDGMDGRGARRSTVAGETRDSVYDTVEAEELATLLCPGDRGCAPPRFVGFNCFFSAARLAPHAVAAGAHHALGFQDAIDEVVAEQFFAAFYSAWRSDGFQNPLDALVIARERLQDRAEPSRNAAIVLWSAESLVVPRTCWASARAGADRPMEVRASGAGTGDDLSAREDFKVLIRPLPTLNYSLLHNDRDMFTRFEVYKLGGGRQPDLDVEVRLHAGDTNFPFRFSCPLRAGLDIVDLRHVVRVPLLAKLLRESHENIRTSLFVEIRCGERVLVRETHPVTLLSADEWRDDDQDRCWLPAFVLPRDPAILTIVGVAQRYLRALTDDPSDSFDGYQRGKPERVDHQVQALWCAFLYELPLGYMNPPPTYTRASQRIRTPTQILNGRHGTCIDLALVFASCLEYLGLLPVLFLIRGHAFPGYWRDWRAPNELFRFRPIPARSRRGESAVTSDELGQGATTEDARIRIQREPWLFQGEDSLAEIMGFVENGALVPFESTLVTRQGSFSRALREGPRNLDPLTFDAMLDIQSARDHGVTPLPLG